MVYLMPNSEYIYIYIYICIYIYVRERERELFKLVRYYNIDFFSEIKKIEF